MLSIIDVEITGLACHVPLYWKHGKLV